MELLELAGIAGPEAELIRAAVEDANRRVRFFQLAFGRAAAAQSLSPEEIAALLVRPEGGRAPRITWQAEGAIARDQLKRVFLALMCLESAMPWGGECLVRHSGDGWHVGGAAERLREIPHLWHIVEHGVPEMPPEPADLHFALFAMELAGAGRRARLERGRGEISLSF